MSRKRTYKHIRGITTDERDRMLVAQGGVCACCGRDAPGSVKGWHVDHDHITGVIRGVLCANCNIALGQVDDNIEHLQKLIDYIRKHNMEGATTIRKE